MPTTDALAIQKEALELVATFPGARRVAGPAQAEALLRIDARLEPVIAQLTQQYTANYQKSTEVETRLWHAVFDLVKAFSAAYRRALRAGYPRADQKRWRAAAAVGPGPPCPLQGYRRQVPAVPLQPLDAGAVARVPRALRVRADARLAARAAGVRRRRRSRGRACRVEQEYLKTLLLMRLDSGNFTPDQVEWVARQLEAWAASLTLVPPPGAGANFFVDLTGSQGLRRQDRAPAGGRLLFLDASPVYTQIVERMRWLPENATTTRRKPGRAAARASSGCC